ncbi:uncharacterized protein LOC144702187 isoform X2 [Wolffia australiana]
MNRSFAAGVELLRDRPGHTPVELHREEGARRVQGAPEERDTRSRPHDPGAEAGGVTREGAVLRAAEQDRLRQPRPSTDHHGHRRRVAAKVCKHELGRCPDPAVSSPSSGASALGRSEDENSAGVELLRDRPGHTPVELHREEGARRVQGAPEERDTRSRPHDPGAEAGGVTREGAVLRAAEQDRLRQPRPSTDHHGHRRRVAAKVCKHELGRCPDPAVSSPSSGASALGRSEDENSGVELLRDRPGHTPVELHREEGARRVQGAPEERDTRSRPHDPGAEAGGVTREGAVLRAAEQDRLRQPRPSTDHHGHRRRVAAKVCKHELGRCPDPAVSSPSSGASALGRSEDENSGERASRRRRQ